MLDHNNSQNGTRKGWIILVAAIVFSLLLSGCAQKPKVYRVGILNVTASFAVIGDGFKAKMTELGYIEGKNIVYIQGAMSTDPAELQRQAKTLVDDKVDLIVAFPVAETAAAFAATQGTKIPVVCAYTQLEGTNLIKTVREPGGNLTGVRFPGAELVSKRLETLHEIAPKVKRVWIGYDKNSPNTAAALGALRPLASSFGVTLVEAPVTKIEELPADLAARAKSADIGLDAILLMPDTFNSGSFAALNKFATEHNIPVAGGLLAHVQQGALLANSADLTNVGQLTAPLADKVLKGTPAGTIPVVTPEQSLFINYKVAQAMGLTVPEGLLKMATQVIR